MNPHGWTFLSNHAHALLVIAQQPEILMRDLALKIGITERAVQRIVGELVDEGYLVREKRGRRNAYFVNGDMPLRHPIESSQTIADLVQLVVDDAGLSTSSASEIRPAIQY
jgi:DNA-binding transcriptional regulator YhcF (GntR family)